MANLPKAVDLSSEFPPVGDQGDQGSCLGWATTYALRSYLERRHDRRTFTGAGGSVDPSKVFSPAFTWNHVNGGQNRGAPYPKILNVLVFVGAVTLAEMPYVSNVYLQGVPQGLVSGAAANRAGAWGRVRYQDVRKLKELLATNYPFCIAAWVDESFQLLPGSQVWKTPDRKNRGAHAMVVVGYDDDRNAFRVLNSWGRVWADNGYGWMDYSLFLDPEVVPECYVVIRDPGDPDAPKKGEKKDDPPKKEDPPRKEDPPKKDDPPRKDDPLKGIQFRISEIRPKAMYLEQAKWGRFVRAEVTLLLPAGTKGRGRVELRFFRSDGGQRGAAVGTRVAEVPPKIRAHVSEEFDLDGGPHEGKWVLWSPHRGLDLPSGSSDVIVVPVLFVDGAQVAEGEARTVSITKE